MPTKRRNRRRRLAFVPPILALGALTATSACEGGGDADARPTGFSEDDARCSAIAPSAFVQEGERVLSRGLALAEHEARAGRGGSPARLGVEVRRRFADGLRLVAPSSPDAHVTFAPLEGASGAAARLRSDGALVAYDNAYARVGVALGAADDRVEEHVRINDASDLPRLRFRLRGGPAFGRWHDQDGALFAYDRDGRGLFELAPPAADGARGETVQGHWRVEGEGDERVIEAELPTELAFPALVALTFKTPTWFPAGAETPLPVRAQGGLVFYEGGQNCAVVFGGNGEASGAAILRNDVAARCEGTWRLEGAGLTVTGTPPNPRQTPAMAFAPFPGDPTKAGAYVFGGFGNQSINGSLLYADLWKLALTGQPGGPRTATWTRVGPETATPPAGTWPARRLEGGMAWTAQGLLLFGGVGGPSNTFLDDTWLFNGTTWQQVCQGPSCFPARRNFAVITRGTGAGAEVLVIGGYGPLEPPANGELSDVLRFTGTGWQKVETFEPDAVATLHDGRLSTAGQSAPGPRSSPWAAGTPAGELVIGSGAYGKRLPSEDWNDAWRLDPFGVGGRWARVPVSTATPGRRIGGMAGHDPVLGEPLVLGGWSLVPHKQNDPPPTFNPSPPVTYKSRANGVSMTVTCRDPNGDLVCDTYELEAAVTLAQDTSPSRGRVVFQRQRGSTWESAGAGCGTFAAPLAPAAGNVFRCVATGAIADSAFAVQAFDGAPPSDAAAECSAQGANAAPINDGVNLYAGTAVCRSLPAANNETLACE